MAHLGQHALAGAPIPALLEVAVDLVTRAVESRARVLARIRELLDG